MCGREIESACGKRQRERQRQRQRQRQREEKRRAKTMGNTSSGEEGAGLASPSILSKVTVKGSKADMDAFLTEGRVNNVQIAYVTKKQVCVCALVCALV